MLRTIFGKKEEDKEPQIMASTITTSEFKDALSRYPAVLKTQIKAPKPGHLPLEELDKFRYVEAPARFSKKTGRTMTIEDVQKLVDWKLRHGAWRPSLPKQVASNTTEKVEAATKDAFDHYAKHPNDIDVILKKLASPLRGIGPATASLLLAVHDPDHVIFFSDEVYKWLIVGEGKKQNPKYTTQEFEALYVKAKALMARLHVNPIDVEKVAFVLIKENEPVYEPKPKKEPSGLPRGRPRLPDSEKKTKKAPSVPGRGRGRPPKADGVATPKAKATGAGKRGRPAKAKAEEVNEEEDEEEEEEKEEEGKDEETAVTPASGSKRKAAASPKSRSAKKAKK
ncbi:hypothetical protein G7Y89_g8682 [Cudoniella acicularis]|uniref:Uncharacterized protein n=1 Tax=Cudoniella acicularis TaxID=354080 RepID=A0A8H4RG44_9HELO|nr:hypothetical protein G7Y89_g8682 [Cudoniella acicularis]